MGVNDRTNWERRLKGEVITLTSDMEPDYGFYRVPTKDRTSWRAMSYYFDDAGKLCCLIDGRELDEQRAREIWSWASRNPITYALYKAVVEDKQPWPDLNPEVTRHHNMAPDDNSFESIQERIDDLAREAERMMKVGGATTQDAADQAADVANKLADYWKKADNLRVVEKQPHLDAERAVDNKYRPMLTAASVYQRLKQVVCAPWLKKLAQEKADAEAAARKVASDATAAARKVEEEARAKAAVAEQTGDMAAIAEAGLATQHAAEVKQQAVAAADTARSIAAASVTVGTRGRGVHLRATPEYTISDRDAVLKFFTTTANNKALDEIDAAILKHAKAIRKTGMNVPGLTEVDDSKAA